MPYWLKTRFTRIVLIVHEVSDLENDFVDVIVRDITGYGYAMVVNTPTSLLKVMNDNSVNFIKNIAEP